MSKQTLSAIMAERGIKETKEFLQFFIALLNTVLQLNPKVLFNSIGQFIAIIPTVQPAIEGFNDIDDEALDLTDEEEKELVAFVTQELRLKNPVPTVLVRDCFRLAINFAKVATSVRELKAIKGNSREAIAA